MRIRAESHEKGHFDCMHAIEESTFTGLYTGTASVQWSGSRIMAVIADSLACTYCYNLHGRKADVREIASTGPTDKLSAGMDYHRLVHPNR